MQFIIFCLCCLLLDKYFKCAIIAMDKSCISQQLRKNNDCRKEVTYDGKDRTDG